MPSLFREQSFLWISFSSDWDSRIPLVFSAQVFSRTSFPSLWDRNMPFSEFPLHVFRRTMFFVAKESMLIP